MSELRYPHTNLMFNLGQRPSSISQIIRFGLMLNLLLFIGFFNLSLNAQCILTSGKIQGQVFLDQTYNGIYDIGEKGIAFVPVYAYDVNGSLAANAITDLNGNYSLNGLTDQSSYRIEFQKPLFYEYSITGASNKGDLQMVQAPACNVSFALFQPGNYYSPNNTKLAVTCFVGGSTLSENGNLETIVEVNRNFTSESAISKIVMKSLTGSVWGLAWNRTQKLLYSSAFIKQNAVLGTEGTGGIYVTNMDTRVTTPFINLSSFGINTGSTAGLSSSDCKYGDLVGKVGLGNLEISNDDQYLFVTNLYNKSIVIIPTINPSSANIIEIKIPDPGCNNGDYAVGGLKYYNGHLYIGVTCTAEQSKSKTDFFFHVYEYNTIARTFNIILSTDFAKSYWPNPQGGSKVVSQWLTDIDFTKDGEMILGIADRKGHAYCESTYPVTNQNGDVLMAFKDASGWHLENGGYVNGRAGSGIGHLEGHGGGEFFGDDYWIVGPSLHPETALGSIAYLANSNEVISTVFDPLYESFAAGMHRYSVQNGKKSAAIQLYNKTSSSFGKASGLGDIKILNGPAPIEIGNFVWLDKNDNGIQDPNEKGIAGLKISLYNASCQKVSSFITNQSGQYLFNETNVDLNADGIMDGLAYNSEYYVVIDDHRFDATKKYFIIGQDTLVVALANAGVGFNGELIDSDVSLNDGGICPSFKGLPVTKIKTGNSGQNYFYFDMGLRPYVDSGEVTPEVDIIDLALIKKINSLGSLKLNDVIEFEIEVLNQGTISIDQYEITDYIPAQLAFDQGLNPAWKLSGNNAIYSNISLINEGELQKVILKLRLIDDRAINSIINTAEISSIKDAKGVDLKDVDSTPDQEPDNDKGGVPNTLSDNLFTGNGIDDEDDHDREAIFVNDLALIKVLSSGGTVKRGDDVIFDILVNNQGNTVIPYYEIVDYIPAGFIFNQAKNPDWTISGNVASHINSNDLNQGEIRTVSIVLEVSQNAVANNLINAAEIAVFKDATGHVLMDRDSKPDQNPNNDPGSEIGTLYDNSFDGDGVSDEDDFDREAVQIADIALINKTTQINPVKLGELVTFELSVFNQGNTPIGCFDLLDYIPSGFEFVAGENPGWTLNGSTAKFTDTRVLEVGATRIISIKLKVISSQYSELVNVAEIGRLKDVNKSDISDWDSTPDSNPINDKGGVLGSATDNMIDGDGIIDEDDQDPASVDVFDLALILTTAKVTPVKINEDVTFKITLCNQGNIVASNVVLIDYVPAGMELSSFDNNGWILQNGKLLNTINAQINPGQCIEKNIILRIKESANSTNITNRAEVVTAQNSVGSDMSNVDVDSNPDVNSTNDAGGVVGTLTDNVLDGNGILDEDDADPETVRIADLALRKRLVAGNVLRYLGSVNFEIEVFNQGNISLKNINIIDYLPKGFSLNPSAVNLGWTMENGYALFNLKNVLNPNEQVKLILSLDAGTGVDFASLNNVAEITGFEDNNGTVLSAFDFDSNPDKNPANDKGGELFSITDDLITDHGNIDEDDADIATVDVFDLALTKKVVNPKLLFKSNDIVEFNIDVVNQGNISSFQTQIIDYVDTNFIFKPELNPGWVVIGTNKVGFIINEEINPTETKSVGIQLVIKSKRTENSFFNTSEIVYARDSRGNDLIDYDSTPDQDATNDKYTGGHPINDHGITDEDDHDKVETNPGNFDLALIKDVNVRTVQRGQEVPWTITIANQGSVTAKEITIVDYLPSGTTLVSPEWSLSPINPDPNKYFIVLNEKNGRLPQGGLKAGEQVKVKIILKINIDRNPGPIVNRAEIFSAVNDFNEPDEDSTPDDVINNDGGGDIFTDSDGSGSAVPDDGSIPGDEDDADPSGVFLLELVNEECICLNNATTPDNGQFSTFFTLDSRAGEIWFIRSVTGLYNVPSPAPPAAPTPFVTGPAGFILPLMATNGVLSTYGFTGIHIDDIGFSIVLENQFGDKVSLGNVRCRYESSSVTESQNNVCIGSTVRYSVAYREGSTYNWSLSSGGVFTSSTTSRATAIMWTGAVGTTHIVRIQESNPNLCIEPIDIPVTIGDQIGSVSCIGELQVSLNNTCQAQITPQKLLQGGPYDYNSYTVMIMNKDGSIVPNALLTHEHLGKTLVAKVLNVCNGNSCWSTIVVEDKIKPTIECLNDTIDCTRMQSYLGPLVRDNCDLNPVKILVDETIEDTRCNPDYSKIVNRKYVAKDNYGNISDTCTMKIFLKRIVLDSIVFPDTLSLLTNNPLICNGFASDSLGRPLPSVSGYPLYHGAPIWPNKDSKYCDYFASYEDIELPNGKNCTRKILRNWKFIIWYCTTFEQRVYNQLIEIVDTTAPTIVCPYNITVTTGGGYVCAANVWIPAPVTFDSCVNDVTVDLVYPGGFIKDFKGGNVVLPAGLDILKFRAYDRCHNVDSCTFEVLVQDRTPPVVQCDRETVVSLDRFGLASVPATSFDDGSYDDCHIKSMQVRRMDDGVPCQLNPNVFADSVGFCCADIGKFVTVMFMVTDHDGNSNTCMVTVEVQDKTIPSIYCPHDVTINCEYHLDTSKLDVFGTPTVSDNCNVTFQEVKEVHINQCREGYIDRIFIAGNSFGSDVCVQRITIINDQPFVEGNIRWPGDFDTTTCAAGALTPGSLAYGKGFPIITEDKCDLVGINYEDHLFRFINGSDACYKIIRKWKVINWCRFYDITGAPIIYEHDQIIKISNKIKPTFTSGCEDKRFDIIDTSCYGGFVKLIATGEDDCTPGAELRWEYHVDLYSNGTEDYSAFGIGDTIDASRVYPLGKHKIKYVFEDLCGNKEVCERQFEIVNIKAPIAYCLKGLAAGLVAMDLNGDGKIDGEMVTLWAKDFDQGSYHPCGYDLTYSLGRDTSVHSMTYDCDSTGIRVVTLCVTATNGQQSCCETFVEIQDNNNVDFCNCVEKPVNLTVSNCTIATEPADLNSFPKIGNCNCTDVSFSKNDVIVSNVPNACYAIDRTWTATFNCPGSSEEFTFKQRITVTTDLKEADIQWPSDTVVVDNCLGSKDTLLIGNTPHYCTYGGNVGVRYVDRVLPPVGDIVYCERTWTVFSKCVGSQSYSFKQILKVIFSTGVKYTVPSDITLTENCKRSFLPDSINGYPKVNCPCNIVVHSYVDSLVTGIPNTCYVIYRKWTSTYNCPPDVLGTFKGTQKITFALNFKEKDIKWPVDSFVVDNCGGRIDTGFVDHKPELLVDFCGYVSITFKDSVKKESDTCKIIQRTWIVGNECTSGVNRQEYRFKQVLKVLFPYGPKLHVPADLTVTDCKKPFLPDSLNGYPTITCACDSLTFTYKDDTLRNNNEVCYVVERNWSVRVRCRPEIDTTLKGIQRITRDVNLVAGDINWPKDTFISLTCTPTLDPNITGRPTLKKDFCGLVTFTFVDSLDNGGTCRTIKRTWTARNACSASQVFKFNQYIITKNQTPPAIQCPPDRTVNADPGICGANVNVGNATQTNDCNTGVTFTNNAPPFFPVGKTNVIFTATDACGNTATCITMITVIENIPPTIICPNDTLVDCSVNTADLSQFGSPNASDNCPGLTVKDSVIRNQNICGIGTITRIFTATDASGNSNSCTQLITINNPDPLDSLEINWPTTPVTVGECASISPDSLGIPSVDTGAATCFKLRITFADSNFCKQRNRCEIDRVWTVFDSCSAQTFNFTQLIIRFDTLSPRILGVRDTTLFASDTACNNFVNLVAYTDACDSATVVFTNDSPYGVNNKNDASGYYPTGTTTVTFTAQDACCNLNFLTIKITVIDTVGPEVTCRKVIKNIKDDSCAVYTSREFIFRLSDNCSDSAKIMASFNKNDFTDTIRIICCDSIRNGNYLGPATVYFKDEAGNIDSCVTLLQALDPDTICPHNFKLAVINGLIRARNNNVLAGIDVSLNNGLAGTTSTAGNGFYNFRDMSLGGAYYVKAKHDVDPLDGVTTYDIVQIQKHILGIKPLDHPYKYIAADVNKSKSVTAADIVEIRKLILGKVDRFKNNESWRFVDSDYKFIDPLNPFLDEFTESFYVPKLINNVLANFTGIKVGDIDDSNKLNGLGNQAQTRTNQYTLVHTEDVMLKAGIETNIELSIPTWMQLDGLQFALNINPALARVSQVLCTEESVVRDESIGTVFMDRGIVNVSWVRNMSDKGQWKLTLKVISKSNVNLSEILTIDPVLMPAEAYTTSNEFNVVALSMNSNQATHSQVKLYQNIPNPYSQSTRIPFELNADSEVILSVIDVNGQVVYEYKKFFTKGYHEIPINKTSIQKSGMYYYMIQTGRDKVYKRMLFLD